MPPVRAAFFLRPVYHPSAIGHIQRLPARAIASPEPRAHGHGQSSNKPQDERTLAFVNRTSEPRLILLKKSMTVVLTRLSWVALPLTDAPERFVGRSERSNFSLVVLGRRATTFSTVSDSNQSSGFVVGVDP